MEIRRWSRGAVVLACVVAMLAPGGGAARQDTGTPVVTLPVADLPEARAPEGLARVALPTDAAAIAALLARLPAQVAGEERTEMLTSGEGGRFGVAYGSDRGDLGPPLAIRVLDVSTGDFFPAGWTADQVILELAAEAGEADGGIEAVGRDGPLVWLRADAGVIEVGYALTWGRVGEPWLFSAIADTRERLDALVAAFVVAASPGPATPVATPGS